jgi:very-short-patch-repair endonuclease
MQTDEAMRELAEQQHGLITRRQAKAIGATTATVRHRLAGPDWEEAGPRVLRLTGAPRTSQQALMAAVLDAGPTAAASHLAAAALWDLPGCWPGPLEVTRPRSGTRAKAALGHLRETVWLPSGHVTTLEGIPCTTVARTLFDLAGQEDARRVERLIDAALARSPALLGRLHSMLDELSAHGRAGIAVMRELLAERPAGYVPPASGLEARAINILERAGIRVERQVDVGGEDWIGRVDLRVTGTKLLVEIDSALHHTSLSDRRRDAARDRAVAAAGFTLVRVTDRDVWTRPDVVVASVRAAA